MMGCTSSTPNMPEILTNTAEITENDENINTGDMKEKDDPIHRNESESSYAKISETDVLPTCDSLDDNIQLPRNNYFTNMNNEQKHEDTLATDVNDDVLESEEQGEERQLSTLKQVADQVLVKNILEDVNNATTLYQEKPSNEEDVNTVVEEKVNELIEEPITDGVEDTNDEDNIEESASPSQSNRSTRWEALADIAAELPPSLAVDPVTGQIYSLTK